MLAWVVARRWMRYSNWPNGRVVSVACWALRIFDAATICIARVICEVLVTDLIRRRSSRGLAMIHRAGLHFQVCLNSSATVLSSAFNASLIAFSFSILASNAAFRVVRKSVSLF